MIQIEELLTPDRPPVQKFKPSVADVFPAALAASFARGAVPATAHGGLLDSTDSSQFPANRIDMPAAFMAGIPEEQRP